MPTRAADTVRERIDLAAVGAWLVPFALVVYLGLNNGGYDIVERSQAAIAVWWVVLVGTVVGALPAAGGTRAGRIAFAVLALFALWTGLALSWTESAERTMIELGRVAAYLGAFALALGLQRDGRWRHVLNGVTAGVTAVVVIAVLSRLEPTWFPDQDALRLLRDPELESRLAYPLNYSSGLAAVSAIALPLLLAATASARMVPARAVAAAAIPLVALALWLTGSSLAIPLAVLGLIAFLALAPDRLPKLATLVVAGAGGAILIAAASAREALDRGLATEAAQSEGDELALIALAVCAAVAAIQVGLVAVLGRWERPALPPVPRPVAAGAIAVGVAAFVVVALATGAPERLSDGWQDFKSPERVDEQDPRERQILDVSSSGRYRYWQSAVDANQTEPVVGIGPGTFEFWWAREGSFEISVRDAHSLYMEVLAELGIVGLLLVAAFTAGVLGVGVVRTLRSSGALRGGLAAATAGCTVFVAAAAVDWVWELGVLPVAFVTLAAIVVAAGAAPSPRDPSSSLRRHLPAAAVIMISIAALVAITIPLAGYTAVQSSRSDAEAGRLGDALADARAAQRLQPYAATPRIQEALILEREGDLDAAVMAATEATSRESTNWRPWLILSRLAAKRGDTAEAIDAFRRARSLNRSLQRG